MENNYSLILFGSNKERHFQPIIEQLKQQELTCQELLNTELKINVIVVKSKTLNVIIFDEIKEQLAENLLLLNVTFYPDNDWLINMIKGFNEQSINLLTGDIIDNGLFSKVFQKQSYSLSNQIENIFNNCIGKKILLEKILLYLPKAFDIKGVDIKESWIYNRILMEIEAELIYSEKIKVIKR